jgi:hypothetical protein
MIDAVWKLIIFVSMLYRITKTSRNERVTLRVYNAYSTSVWCMYPWSHGTHLGGGLIHKLQHTKCFLLWICHFLFVTSWTDRGGKADCTCDQNLNTCCFAPCGKHTSACIFKAIMAAWNRSSHFGTWCITHFMKIRCLSFIKFSTSICVPYLIQRTLLILQLHIFFRYKISVRNIKIILVLRSSRINTDNIPGFVNIK